MIPVYIINFNYLKYVKQMVEELQRFPVIPIIVDNHSTYPPLLDWYRQCKCRVIYMDDNYKETVVWDQKLLHSPSEHKKLFGDNYYVVTDPDLDLSSCPNDLIDILKDGLRRYISYVHFPKCGVGVEYLDIPPEHHIFINCQKCFWERPLDDFFFWAEIDTTFAVYSIMKKSYSRPLWHALSLRANRPYTVRHLPYYVTKLDQEDRYYLATARHQVSSLAVARQKRQMTYL